jgi:type III pantothenate kinase
MLLLLDIGNTAATYGISHKNRIIRSGSCLYNDIPKIINNCLRSGEDVKLVIVLSSVVPKITSKIRSLAKSKKVVLRVVGQNLEVPIKSSYRKGQKVGSDRIVNVYGALRRYPPPALMIDFGTAITFDYISKGGVFEGGMIVPGPEISFQALITRAALLPKSMRLPKKASSFLGKTTYDCMTSGILQGFGAMTDGLILRFKTRYGKLKVIATGGFASHLKPFVSGFDVVDPLHSIKSLQFLAKSAGIPA